MFSRHLRKAASLEKNLSEDEDIEVVEYLFPDLRSDDGLLLLQLFPQLEIFLNSLEKRIKVQDHQGSDMVCGFVVSI